MSPQHDRSTDSDADDADDADADDGGFGERIADFLDRIGLEELTDDYRDEHRAAERRLAAAFDPLPDRLAETPAIGEVNKVNTHDDGGDVLVPVVTVLFEAAGDPDIGAVWELTGRLLEAVQRPFADHHVRYYDLQYAYANEAEDEVIYRRITVHPPLVERFLTDPGFDVAALRAAVADGDNGDDGVPPVDWKQFDARSRASSGTYAANSAAIAAACASSSAGAAAACAASTGTAGAAGGAGSC